MNEETEYTILAGGDYFFEILKYIRTVFSIIVTLLLTSLILGIKIPINISSVDQFAESLLLFWGYLILINSVLNIPLYIIVKKYNIDESIILVISRILLIVTTVISMLIQTKELVKIGGIIGLALALILYIVTREWYLFPGDSLFPNDDAISLAQLRALEVERKQGEPSEQPAGGYH